jgi:hypothetical protein
LDKGLPETKIIQAYIKNFPAYRGSVHIVGTNDRIYKMQSASDLVLSDQFGQPRFFRDQMGPGQAIIPVHEFLDGPRIPACQDTTFHRTISVDLTTPDGGIIEKAFPASLFTSDFDQFLFKGNQTFSGLIKDKFSFAKTDQIPGSKNPVINQPFVLEMQTRAPFPAAGPTPGTFHFDHRHTLFSLLITHSPRVCQQTPARAQPQDTFILIQPPEISWLAHPVLVGLTV